MLILYTSEDGKSRIQLRTKDQTVWLSQREMGELFDVSTDNVGLHLKNIFAEGELEENSVTEESSVTAADGKTYDTLWRSPFTLDVTDTLKPGPNQLQVLVTSTSKGKPTLGQVSLRTSKRVIVK